MPLLNDLAVVIMFDYTCKSKGIWWLNDHYDFFYKKYSMSKSSYQKNFNDLRKVRKGKLRKLALQSNRLFELGIYYG